MINGPVLFCCITAAGYGYEMYDERFGVGQCAIYRKFL